MYELQLASSSLFQFKHHAPIQEIHVYSLCASVFSFLESFSYERTSRHSSCTRQDKENCATKGCVSAFCLWNVLEIILKIYIYQTSLLRWYEQQRLLTKLGRDFTDMYESFLGDAKIDIEIEDAWLAHLKFSSNLLIQFWCKTEPTLD